MKLLVFDTETTNIRPGQICQLAYISDNDGEVTAKNLFFTVDGMSESSFAVHGLSTESLEKLSDGKRFADSAYELRDIFLSADVVCGHNVAADMRFIDAEFERLSMEKLKVRTFCTMNSFTKVMMLKRKWPAGYPKPPRLSELAQYLDISFEEAEDNCVRWFDGGSRLHDARFDAAITYMCILEGVRRQFITL